MKWTATDDRRLRDMRERGTPPREIAEKLGRSESAVCQRAVRSLGLDLLREPKRFWADDEIKTLRDLFPSTSAKTIGVMLGRTAQSVRDRCKTEGLFRRDYPL